MTLPFENDTNPIVKKISKRNLKADKSRNVLIIITIALSLLLLHCLCIPALCLLL